jgi:cysteine desulfurase
MRSYLDHNATTPVRPEAIAAISDALRLGGNASSVHEEGRAAKALLERAREQVAALVGARAVDVTFTSGGTEASNLVMNGAKVDRVLVSAIEHPCVLDAAARSRKVCEIIPVTPSGVVDLAALETLLAKEAGETLVAVMQANNETGIVQPLNDVVALAHTHGAQVYCDAVQAAGKMPVNMALSGVDCLSLSAHKIGGAAGAGALIAQGNMHIDALQHGGGQELRRRPGTENLSGIAGFGAAAERVARKPVECGALRDTLENGVKTLRGDAVFFGADEERLSNTSFFATPGLSAEMLVIAFDLAGIAVSSGSACSSGKVSRSHVLDAMGADPELANGAIRVSLGWTTTQNDVEAFLAAFEEISDRAGKPIAGEAA